MQNIYDTIFFSEKRAKKIAKEKNKIGKNKIQLCYYFGKKTKKNLVAIKLKKLKQFFLKSNYRLPKYCDFNESEYENNDKLQTKIAKAIAYQFEEVKKEKEKLTLKLYEKFKKIKFDKNKTFFIISKKNNFDYKFIKKLAKKTKNSYIVSEKSKKNFILDEISIIDILKKLIKYKPKTIVFYNEFFPFFFNEQIKVIIYIDNFKIVNEIVEYEKKLNLKNVKFFVSNYIQAKILAQKNIKANKFLPIIKNKKVISKEKKYNLAIIDDFFDIEDLLVFKTMYNKIEKFLDENNLLDLNSLVEFIKKSDYYDYEDWELNLYLQKNILVQYFVKKLQNKNDIIISGANWDKCKFNKIKIKTNQKKVIQKSKYVLYINNPINTQKLYDIIRFGAKAIVYDLRVDDKFYEPLSKNIIFFKSFDELNQILEEV